MYTALTLILIGISVWMLIVGISKKRKKLITGGIIVGILTAAFFWFMGFWGEYLWFDSIEYAQRFWILKLAKYGFGLSGLIIAGLLVLLLTAVIPREKRRFRWGAVIFAAIFGALWGSANWPTILKYVEGVSTDIQDPVFNMNTGFYLFDLPFYDSIIALLLVPLFLALVSTLLSLFVTFGNDKEIEFQRPVNINSEQEKMYKLLYLDAALIIIILAASKFLARYHLLYSDYGVVSGPGWTDVNVKLPGYTISIIITLIAAIGLLIPAGRKFTGNLFKKTVKQTIPSGLSPILYSAGIMLVTWFLFLTVIPAIFQWLIVEPNEVTYEEPYIANNIEFTRYGFGLDEVEEREFPVDETFTRETLQNNPNLFDNIRLWDPRALDAVYKQFQEIRLYYEFNGIDIDRYDIDGNYKEVMVSAREMELENLPEQSKTFVNKRFKYTHGYGITMTKVSDFTTNGLPNLLIKDIPPKTNYPELEIKRPEIYYGTLTNTHVVVNSETEEFDYPSGEKNVYTRYEGNGGVQITNFWRKFLFGYKFDGTRFLFSGYPTFDSRIMFHRNIVDRVNTLAPFLKFDHDPYVVLADDGKIYWIIDAYTTSTYYPYSEPFNINDQVTHYRDGGVMASASGKRLRGENYVRNSVKIVIDAYNGNTDLYIFDQEDPLVKTWSNIFPDLFKTQAEMPAELTEHIRYPADYLLTQGLVYAKYHMTDPTVFYNQEDLWIRATEKYYGSVQKVEPYYVMWKPPESDKQEFILMLPFTPKNRQVAIGWIAGMCDPGNYGRFLAYKFPKEKRVLGPQQVETKIDQDSYLSGQLTLWDQRGSNVIRGNVLAIPISQTILYVEPIYLQAETAAYPELRLVAVMHGDNLSYAENFDEALKGLFGEAKPTIEGPDTEKQIEVSLKEYINRATNAFKKYQDLTGQGEFGKASKELQKLKEALEQLEQNSGQPE